MSSGAYGFLNILNAAGVRTVVSRDLDEDYQGSVTAIVQGPDCYWRVDQKKKFGYLTIGYGLNSPVEYLREARWFDNLEELKRFFSEFDHATQWYGRKEQFRRFADEVMSIRHGDEFERD
ncbi:hypothetical protein SAMN05421776_11723 [Nocardia farcinica]|uniref:Uncharacterized protein n=1 Tax=Nocardia farcinica TaxID=37329 RepID=A0A0H5NWI7_NOCFR|nr:hypothetical protein [Nocardia farcinica]AXK86563.1 hypothetical protein DXT66_13835 [Nocardia farcinica]PFW99030.1 hypothetical protein CJ469_05630 [Nocardia farcinica]PFX06068.1 hypothetical protein CJ468_04928 [Nocardia farcinica]CRY79842.1 Uncharacterised protein [Nocardia farcinica]SIT33584.1 hypothetical protein SAMN05421776_11723 [Nocardia farcinica]